MARGLISSIPSERSGDYLAGTIGADASGDGGGGASDPNANNPDPRAHGWGNPAPEQPPSDVRPEYAGHEGLADVIRPVATAPYDYHGYTNGDETGPYKGDGAALDRQRAGIEAMPATAKVSIGPGIMGTRKQALAGFDASHPKGTISGSVGNQDSGQIFGVSDAEKNYSNLRFTPDKTGD